MKKKRVSIFIFCICLCISICGCTNTAQKKSDIDSKHKETVDVAINTLKKAWNERYDSREKEFENIERYVEIKNTRIVHIKDNAKGEFIDVDCIVEFMLLTNEYNTTPYYVDSSLLRFVVIKKDGTAETQHINPLMMEIRSNGPEISHMVEYVTELDDAFNQVLDL